MWQLPLGGIGDDAQRREGNPAIRGDFRGYVRFHVDRVSAGLQMQIALALAASDRRVDACKINQRSAKSRRQGSRPDGIGVNSLAAIADDRARHQHRAGGKSWREPSRNPETDDGADVRRRRLFEFAPQPRAVAAARYDVNMRPRREFGLGLEAGDGDDAPARRMRAYIPNCVARRLPFFKLR